MLLWGASQSERQPGRPRGQQGWQRWMRGRLRMQWRMLAQGLAPSSPSMRQLVLGAHPGQRRPLLLPLARLQQRQHQVQLPL